MAVPNWKDARLFYRCAFVRYEESVVLSDNGYKTGAVYLAGYGIECILKALALMAAPESKRGEILKSFKGNKAHDFEWLLDIYLNFSGASVPPDITKQFGLVSDWSTDLRYAPNAVKSAEADRFIAAVKNYPSMVGQETVKWRSISRTGRRMRSSNPSSMF